MTTRLVDPSLFHPGAADPAPGSGQPVLAGSRCSADGTVVFPAQASCPRCSGSDITTVALPVHGTLWSWTVQHFAPKEPFRPAGPEFVPFPLGYVDLGEVLVESRLQTDDVAALQIGMPVRLGWQTAWTEPDGTDVLTFAFSPTEVHP